MAGHNSDQHDVVQTVEPIMDMAVTLSPTSIADLLFLKCHHHVILIFVSFCIHNCMSYQEREVFYVRKCYSRKLSCLSHVWLILATDDWQTIENLVTRPHSNQTSPKFTWECFWIDLQKWNLAQCENHYLGKEISFYQRRAYVRELEKFPSWGLGFACCMHFSCLAK